MSVAAGLLHAHDLLHHARVVARQERLARDDHVDLVGAGGDRLLGVAQLDLERRLAGRERRGDRGGPHARARERFARHADQRRVDAHRRARGDLGHGRRGADGLGAQVADLAGRVGALERREVEHRHRQPDALLLRGRLDRALAEHGGALLDADAVDVWQAADHPLSMARGRHNRRAMRSCSGHRARRLRRRARCPTRTPTRRRRLQHARPPGGARRAGSTCPRSSGSGSGSILPLRGRAAGRRSGRARPAARRWAGQGVDDRPLGADGRGAASTRCPPTRTASRPRWSTRSSAPPATASAATARTAAPR